MTTRFIKGANNVNRHSLLDELTFNRDFDLSSTDKSVPRWQFEPSYSGFAANRLRHAGQRGDSRLRVSLMETAASERASTPQVVPTNTWRTSLVIKHNPNLRAFVTDKLTNVPHAPATLERPPFRKVEHTLVHDHEQSLLVNVSTASQFMPSGRPPLFPDPWQRPRMTTTHEPGRHRFFLGDIGPKI